MTADLEAVRALLVEAQRIGFLGPASVDDQVAHALGLTDLLDQAGIGPARFLDLGSGGGLPGLVLASRWAQSPAVLLDASTRRCDFLRRAVVELGWQERVAVWSGRGEVLARTPDGRTAFPVVVARAFGAPAVTAEIGGAFAEVGGVLVVSEPPNLVDAASRWPADDLSVLGLSRPELHVGETARVVVIRRTEPVGDRWPRGDGVPSKRPLWKVPVVDAPD